MFQGTTESAAWQIVQTGFATTATLDAGWYGKGSFPLCIQLLPDGGV
jgi:hypothetical protein